jgi:hypothetical protein
MDLLGAAIEPDSGQSTPGGSSDGRPVPVDELLLIRAIRGDSITRELVIAARRAPRPVLERRARHRVRQRLGGGERRRRLGVQGPERLRELAA